MAAIPQATPRTITAIDEWHEHHREAPRPHMGASILGHECERYIWLTFRWAVPDNSSGRLLRLFRRGQREEEMFVRDLRAIGVKIHHTSDPFSGDGGQFHINLGCHVGGSVDGIIESGLPEAPSTRHIAEFKTHNEKSFAFLTEHGILSGMREQGNIFAKTLMKHYVQMQLYMLGTGIDRAFYMAVNKNTDELYTERIAFDKQCADWALARGQRLATSDNLPPPIANGDANFWICKMCSCMDFCWNSSPYPNRPDLHWSKEINCRTCAHFASESDGRFTCNFYGKHEIPDAKQQYTGCHAHVMLPDLVPWTFAGGTENGLRAYYSIDNKRVLNGLEGNDPDNPLDRSPEANESLSTRHIFEGHRSRTQTPRGANPS